MLDDAGFRVFAVAFGDGDKKPETRHIKHQTPGPSVHQVRDPEPYSLRQVRDPNLHQVRDPQP